MASDRPDVRTDPIIEVARRGAVTLALLGGLAMVLASLVQVITGETAGALTLLGALPTVVVAFVMRRQERPNVILLMAMICAFAIGTEVYAAWNGQTEYVAGVGSEAVVFGLGILAVFIARERPAWVAVGFLSAAMIPVVVSQVHLSGPSLEIATDAVVVISVMGTLMYLVVRVMDSLTESRTRYSDLASVIPVATYELDLTAVIDELRSLEGSAMELTGAENRYEVFDQLMRKMRLSFFNDTARGMVEGYGTWYDFVSGDNAGPVHREAVKVLMLVWQGVSSGDGEFTASRLDGSEESFIYRWAIGRRPGANSPVRLVLAATDVTRLRDAEAALEQQLRERDQFVASVSHELRTPLTAIMGLTEELVGRADDFGAAERAELLEIVASETRDVVDIVEDLLVTARAEAGQLQVTMAACDLAEEMERIADLMGGETYAPGPVWAKADPGRLRQVLRNLLSNAHRHGGPHVRMAVTAEDGRAVFEVRDDGAPLPIAERRRIFEPYERASDEGVVGSVGLGLHVARVLARLMGGDLTYDHDGRDAVFRLELALAPAGASAGD